MVRLAGNRVFVVRHARINFPLVRARNAAHRVHVSEYIINANRLAVARVNHAMTSMIFPKQ
jgi:hypothetical protein